MQRVQIAVRLPLQHLDWLDQIAKVGRVSRSEALRRLVEQQHTGNVEHRLAVPAPTPPAGRQVGDTWDTTDSFDHALSNTSIPESWKTAAVNVRDMMGLAGRAARSEFGDGATPAVVVEVTQMMMVEHARIVALQVPVRPPSDE